MLAGGTVFTGPSLVEVQIPHTILSSPDTLTPVKGMPAGRVTWLDTGQCLGRTPTAKTGRGGRGGRNGERSIPFRGPRRVDEEQVGQPCFLDRHTVSWTARLGGGPAEPL